MKIIVGLGNPGSEYAHTRHNIGFEVIDGLAERYHIALSRNKFKALYGKGVIDGEEVLLVKPLTFMNASGEAVGPLIRYYKLSADDLLVIHDDLDLPVGKIRLRQKGSAGGHNGLKSVIQHLNTQDFDRVKVGIGHPQGSHQAVIHYVLNGFSGEEAVLIGTAIDRASEAAAEWVTVPFPQVMNKYNANK
ncbi:aminoacyl-tRNA hydrolase [Sporolactobacillus putidus]|uniref:Peptidyl-tRNA hydrolase n=1 Tax=Sporolactobacillus putidus TaxID=492735 RepID=A0A917S8A0_9BACL|nr:aminoacyl-tRNA hydrolase [Sporolactobacillus putidus]GGL64135.1 peptidyl-tRNA hydrolase [Sporolactobacillus putidus]